MASFLWWSPEQILWSKGPLVWKNVIIHVITPGAEHFTSNTLAKVVKTWLLLFSKFKTITKWWLRDFWTHLKANPTFQTFLIITQSCFQFFYSKIVPSYWDFKNQGRKKHPGLIARGRWILPLRNLVVHQASQISLNRLVGDNFQTKTII